jgi:quinate dehydrogenase
MSLRSPGRTSRPGVLPSPPRLALAFGLFIMSPADVLTPARTGSHKNTYLFGYPLKRSYAPFLHNTLTRLADVPRHYSKLEMVDGMDHFPALARQDDFGGAAVTM